jgi:hypothetical protein
MQAVDPRSILDEVEDADLANGAKTNPERVFRAVFARKSDDALARIVSENAPLAPMPWTTIPGVTQIISASDLIDEGRRMEHCVGVYADRCRRGECYILRLPDSTAEILRDGSVYQHRARKNEDPSPKDTALLARWVASRRKP